MVAFSIIHHQPPWLAEGIATYFERAESRGGHVEIGKPRADYGEQLAHRRKKADIAANRTSLANFL